MFERYTEKARRTIFFGRYEASHFGSLYIETEHLLLGLLREDKALANCFLRSYTAAESIRKRIEGHTAPAQKVPTSVDLPLSHECTRVLAYAAEEAERFHHKHIETGHLLLGLLREEKCFAAQLLAEQGVTLHAVRRQVQPSEAQLAQGGSAFFRARLDYWLAGREALGGIRAVRQNSGLNKATHFAIYAVDPPVDEDAQDVAPAAALAKIQRRIDFIVGRMEHAIANHEFDKARLYSDEERKERENLRLLYEQFNLEEPPPRVPLLCIEIIRDDRFFEIQKRCDNYIAEGITQVWLLDPNFKRAYTVTKAEGLREFRGAILQIANPPLEMDLTTLFDG